MIYLSRMLGKPVLDAQGEEIGHISDIAIATGEVFPRVTSLAFKGPDRTPFMLSWRKYVAEFDGEQIALNVPQADLRFSYLQPDEVLLARDLMSKQIVDTQGMKVVRVNDLKLSESRNQLRLLGAEVGARGILRGISPALETATDWVVHRFGGKLSEHLIAWNYMDLLDRDLSQVKLSVTHKRLDELHPADVADIIEQLSPSQRAAIFTHLDNESAADTISELEDELQADVIDDLSESRASDLLAEMDPDDAADIIGDLPYDKAERLLRLMGVEDASSIRSLLGYKDKTAGGIMTPEVTTVSEDMTVQAVIEKLRAESAEHESVYYVYVVEAGCRLSGVISLRDLLMSSPDTLVSEIAERDLFTAHVDDDQEDVAEQMSKYDLLALPVLDENGCLLGIVTVDDALDVLEEESAEDLEMATGRRDGFAVAGLWQWVSRNGWLVVWGLAFLSAAGFARWATTSAHGGPSSVYALALTPLMAILFSPVVLRIAEDVASHAMSRVIEADDEDSPPLWRRLAFDGLSGLGLGLLIGLITFGVADLALATQDNNAQTFALGLGTALGLAVLVVTIAGTIIGWFAEKRAAADKKVSQASVSVALMAIGATATVVFVIALAVLTTSSIAAG
ncbi:MAG: CBS domain-containing protein [Coriobacteriia bacterium]|nr:CBS domain-containing protein [Coriobacteriia bacterium]